MRCLKQKLVVRGRYYFLKIRSKIIIRDAMFEAKICRQRALLFLKIRSKIIIWDAMFEAKIGRQRALILPSNSFCIFF
jgi:hypothetical protein